MPEFRAAGIQLAVENHDRFPASVLARLVERLGPDQAGICLDTVNSFARWKARRWSSRPWPLTR